MRLKPKLLNAIILGLTMFLSMQTAFAACKQSFAAQQKKVATITKRELSRARREPIARLRRVNIRIGN